MNRIVLAGTLGGALVLAGCSLGTRPVLPHHYALVASTATAQAGGQADDSGKVLQLTRISVPPWLQGNAMYYRLDYEHDDRVASYAQSDWLAPPARMLEPLIQTALASDPAWRAVIGPAGSGRGDASLQIRLDDFSQVFTSSRHSVGRLEATATLIENPDSRVVTQKHFHIEVAAPSADAAGGVKALNDAGRQFAIELREWVRATTDQRASREPARRPHQAG